jgi:hypothetical protein
MRIPGFSACLVTMLFFPGTAALALQSGELTVSVDLEAARHIGPLQVVGFKMAKESTEFPIVVLRNLSSRATDSFWFSVRVSCANPSSTSESQPPLWELGPGKTPQDAQWPHESIIPPGGQGEAHVPGLQGGQLMFSGRSVGCSCLRASVRVTHVKFAEGADWDAVRATNSDPQPLNAVSEEHVQPCRESRESATVLKDVIGGGFRAGVPTHADDTIFRAFSVQCSLQQRDGNWMVMCPM